MPDGCRPHPWRTVAASAACCGVGGGSHHSARRRGPRALSRRAFRHPASLPEQPLGVEVLAAVKHARMRRGRAFPWDARLETSAIAVLAYLWRRGRGEKWAGCHGSARYGCSIAQLVMGLAAIMGWRGIPDRKDEEARARFVKRHRKSVQRWLDWLELAGLVSHTPQQDEEGFGGGRSSSCTPARSCRKSCCGRRSSGAPAGLNGSAVDRRAAVAAISRRSCAARGSRGRRGAPAASSAGKS